jgi:phosphatidylinositol glycan class B
MLGEPLLPLGRAGPPSPKQSAGIAQAGRNRTLSQPNGKSPQSIEPAATAECLLSTTQSVSFLAAPALRVMPKAAALALPLILILGFALRIGVSLTQTHTLFLDETMQYFEQGHRLAFGSGVVSWEFADGTRSWLLPGLIALVMSATARISDDPMLYVGVVHALCVLLSMVVVVVGFRAGQRDGGRMGAIVTGGLCAIWYDLIYFAPGVMTEILAAHCAIAALYLGEGERSTRRVFWIGALFGAAVCLRYQYAPALLVAVLWQYRRQPRHWQWLFLGATSVLLPFSGVLDAITWGAAFQSIWLNFIMNSMQGIAAAIGTQSPAYYSDYVTISFMPLPLLLALAAVGATRFPALAVAAAATLVTQSLLPHKEVRYVYLALAAAPILIGLGATQVIQRMPARLGSRAMTIGASGFLAVGAVLSLYLATTVLPQRWSFQRGMVHAFLAAHREPALCGLQVRDVRSWRSGGYTYLNRDVPLMFEPYVPEVWLPGVPVPLRYMVEREGGPVPQIRSPYSHVIAEAAHPPAGFDQVACFPGDARPGEPELCLFRRPTGCS